MNDAPRSRPLRRSIGAVLAGFLVIVVLSLGTDAVLHATGIFAPPGQPMGDALYVLAAAYRFVYAVLGCYVAARLAPARPMRHALVLGIIGLGFGIVGAAATWNRGPAFGPHWYPVAVAAIALPCAWVGGRLQGMGRKSA